VEASPIAIRVGDLVIGVRTNHEEMTALLHRALRPHVEADLDAPPNLSLSFGEPEDGKRRLHFLYRSGYSVVRTNSPGRLLRGAIRHLEGYAPAPRGTKHLNAKLLVRDGDATLVDARFGGTVDIVERRLHRLGYRLVDVGEPLLDLETLEIKVEAPRLDPDPDGRAEIDRRYPPTPHEVELHDVRYRVRGLVTWGDPAPDGYSPAKRHAELTPLATARDGTIAAEDLDLLVRVSRSWEILRIEYPDARQLLAALRDLTDRASR
jgi:hypothetical protein